MATQPIRANAVVQTTCTTRVHALGKHVSTKTEIPIAGESYKHSEVVGVYERSLETRAAVATKRAELKAALADQDEADVSRRKVDKGLRAWVTNTFGPNSQEAHEFGFSPAKGRASVKTKCEALEKSKATREAHHTMGSKQKKEPTAAPPIVAHGATVVVVPNGDAAHAVASGASPPTPASNGASPKTA